MAEPQDDGIAGGVYEVWDISPFIKKVLAIDKYTLIERLMADGRNDELLQSTQDQELQKKLMIEYGIQDLES